jgi:predicted HAD superfamily Cof-like phosphohydrolase
MKLIEEEFIELTNGILSHDMEQIADGAADLIYVVVGTCVSYGIPIDRIFKEVHRSNMTKVYERPADEGSKYAGQNPKGEGYMAPDINGILTHRSKQTLLETKYEDRDFESED